MITKPTIVVIAAAKKEYKRFVGATLTHWAGSNIHLTAEQVELYRVNPAAFYYLFDSKPNFPGAA